MKGLCEEQIGTQLNEKRLRRDSDGLKLVTLETREGEGEKRR